MESDQVKKSEQNIKGRHGEIVELHGTQPDIAKRKSAQQSRKDWEITFDAMSEWIVLIDLEGRILRTNRAGESFTGKSSTEIVGQTCCKLVHGSDKHLPGCPLHRMLETRQHESIEFLIQDTNRWLMVSTDPVINTEGKLVGAVHVTGDISERKKAEKTIQENKERYRHIFEQSPLGIGLATADGKVVRANKAMEVITGYFEEELKKINLADTYENPEDREKLLETIRRYGCAVDFPVRMKRKDGTVYDALLNVSRVRFEDRELFQTICMDVTERKKAQEALRESEEMFRSIFETSLIGVAICSTDKKWLFVNDQICKILGYSEQELRQTTWDKLTHPEDLEADVSLYNRLLAGEIENYNLEKRFIQKDGSVVYSRIYISCKRNQYGAVEYDIGLLEDITERKRAEEELRESEEKYRYIFENAREAIITMDIEGKITNANKIVEEYGFTRGELLGRTLFDFITKDYLAESISNFETLIGGNPVSGEMDVITPKGIITIEYVDNPIEQDGEIIGVQSILTDITERKRAEEAYHTLVDHSLQGLVIFQNERIIFTNKAMAEITGYSVEEMLKMSMEEVEAFVHPEDRDLVWSRHRDRLKGEKPPEQYEFRGICKNGSICWLEIQASRIEYLGKPAIQATYIDITDRKRAEEALRESEEHFRGLYENAVIGLYRTAPDGRILMANPALVQMLGFSDFEELAERNLEKIGFVPEYPRSAFKERIEKEGQVIGLESAWIRRDGTSLYVRESAKAIRDKQGNILYYEGTIEDVSEHKKAQDALRQSEQSYRRLIDTAQEGVWIVDTSAKTTYVNQQMAAMLGYSQKEMLGLPRFYFMDEQASIKAKQLFERRKNGIAEQHDFRFQHKNGSDVWTIVSTNPIFDDKGRFIGALAMISDISSRKLAEDALRASENKYRDLFENAREAIVITDLNGKILNVNRMVEEYGYKKTELISKDLFDFIPRYDKARAISDFENLIAGNPVRGEMDVITPEGTMTVEYNDNPIELEGKVIGVQIILTDITARKRAERMILAERDKAEKYLNIAPTIILALDHNADITLLNNDGCKILECDRDQAIGKNWFENFLPDSVKGGAQQIFRKLMDGETKGVEFSEHIVRTAKGNEKLIHWHNTIFKDESGNITGTLSSGEDITKRKLAEKALRCSEERLKILFECAPDGIYLHDLQGRFVDGNKAAEAMTGFNREELIGKNFAEAGLLLEEQLPKAFGNLRKIARRMPTGPDEFDLKRKDGTSITVEIRTFPVTIENQILALGIARDITERKIAQEALHKSEVRYRELFNNMKSGVAVYESVENGRDFIFKDLNQAAERIDKVKKEDIIGKKVSEMFPGLKEFGLLEVFQRVWETGKPEHYPASLYQDNRLSAWFENYVYKLPSGEIVAVHEDVTEQKKATEEIENLAKFPAESPYPVLRISGDGTILYANDASSPIRNTWRCEGDKCHTADFVGLVRKALSSDKVFSVELDCYDGRTFEVTFAPVAESDYVNVYGIDITERKRSEQKVLEYQNSLRFMASELSATEERERRRIAEGLHDEIIQSLAFLDIKLDSLRNPDIKLDLTKSYCQMQETVRKLINMTRSFTFDLSSPVLYELGLEAAIEEWLVTNIEEKYAIATILEDDGSSKPLDDDMRAFLFKSVKELLVNVVKHAKASKVRVSISRDKSNIRICVEDNGVGFHPDKKRENLLDFSGFGLFSIRERLDYLQGYLDIESELGHGSRVTMVAPLKPEATREKGGDNEH